MKIDIIKNRRLSEKEIDRLAEILKKSEKAFDREIRRIYRKSAFTRGRNPDDLHVGKGKGLG